MLDSQLKLSISYICTGKYNIFFKDFYESFQDCFCKGHKLSFVIATDQPSSYCKYKDCKLYHVQRYFKHSDLNFIKFRKWHDILLAEDFLQTQDYCFYMNGNLRCHSKVTLDDLFNGKQQYAVYHSLFDKTVMDMKESLTTCKQSAAYFDAWNSDNYPNYKYYQAGNVGATSKEFLRMCHFIESSRHYDAYHGFDKYIKWHDETYYNKYINTLVKKNPDSINILDGKKYLCSWLNQMKPYIPTCKMILVDKDKAWRQGVK